jgi:hypothetical protein
MHNQPELALQGVMLLQTGSMAARKAQIDALPDAALVQIAKHLTLQER